MIAGVAVVGVFTAGFTTALLVGAAESPPVRVVAKGRVPKVIYAGNPDDGGGELRVCFPESPEVSRTLFPFGRSAAARFDESGEWCAVSDLAGSSESYTRIFRRRVDLDYVEVKDISGDAWKFFGARGNKIPHGPYDHAYVNPVAWIPGGRPLLLVSLTGHDGLGSATDCWQCLYDAQRGEFLSDFEASDNHGVKKTGSGVK